MPKHKVKFRICKNFEGTAWKLWEHDFKAHEHVCVGDYPTWEEAMIAGQQRYHIFYAETIYHVEACS